MKEKWLVQYVYDDGRALLVGGGPCPQRQVVGGPFVRGRDEGRLAVEAEPGRWEPREETVDPSKNDALDHLSSDPPPTRAELEGAVDSIMDERSDYLRSRVEEAQPPTGVVSREAADRAVGIAWSTGFAAGVTGDEQSFKDLVAYTRKSHERVRAALSAPSEPMVTRARAERAVLEAMQGIAAQLPPHEVTALVHRILDGAEEARDGE